MQARAQIHRPALLAPLGMALLLAGCGDPAPGEGMQSPLMEKPMPEIVPAQQALQSPDLTTVDLQTLHASEIAKVLPAGPRCSFAYTAESPPVLAATATGNAGAQGVIKLHGRLVKVSAADVPSVEARANGARFTTEGVTLTVSPANAEDLGSPPWEADLVFELQQGLRVGYRGWYSCAAE